MTEAPPDAALTAEDRAAVEQARAVARMLAAAVSGIPCDPVAATRAGRPPDHPDQ